MLNKLTIWSRQPLALLWLCAVLAVAWQQWGFWQNARIDTDIMALLPTDEHAPVVQKATRQLSEHAARQIVILVGAERWDDTRRAADAIRQALTGSSLTEEKERQNTAALLDFYQPWRNRLLTSGQRQQLSDMKEQELAATALQLLYQPASVRLTPWQNDPLGLWPAWWNERMAETPLRLRDDQLWLNAEGRDWILLRYQNQGPAFDASADGRLHQALAQAGDALQAVVPGATLVWSGIPRYAEAAATQASREMSTIGLGSLLAVLLAIWLCFRSVQPIALIALSLLIGCAAALSVTSLLFERVHVLTLVFGASLVGVAEDYGFHYFSARQGQALAQRHAILRKLLPGMLLALLTSVLAYLTLGLAPFPGLRQMAVFSATGLTAAFLTVVCWFPLMDRKPLPETQFAQRLAASLEHWPRAGNNTSSWIVITALSALLIVGLYRLESNDDLRQLQSAPPELLAEQKQLGKLLSLPSPAQFYLVSGSTPEQVLNREEALTKKLDDLVQRGTLNGYQALTGWLPSAARQAENMLLSERSEQTARQQVGQHLGESLAPPSFSREHLTVARWLAGPVPAELKQRWLGEHHGEFHSVVQLRGLSPAALAPLAQAAEGLSGVQWVDKTSSISRLMARYRLMMTALLVAGYLAVFAALAYRYGKQAWRAWLPTLLGSLLTLALLGLAGEPLQLFVILALLLLLGMGIDYGIFLLEHPGDGHAWLAVALAGVSTLLSFGLLALSATPALRSFGLTMLIGETLIWLLTPLFRARSPYASSIT